MQTRLIIAVIITCLLHAQILSSRIDARDALGVHRK